MPSARRASRLLKWARSRAASCAELHRKV